MGDVYAQALEVFICLGEDHDGISGRAVAEIRRLAAECHRNTEPPRSVRPSVRNPPGPEEYEELKDLDMEPLQAFYSSPWFGRLWTMQEVLLAKSATCLMGKTSVSWTDVALTSQSILCRRRLWHFIYNEAWFAGVRQVSNLWEFKQTSPSLYNLLSISQQRQATLPEDKIYGSLAS